MQIKNLKAVRLAAIGLIILFGVLFIIAWSGKMEEVVTASGIVESSLKKEIYSSLKEAYIKKIWVEVGSPVQEGQLLVSLATPELLEETKIQAEIEMKRAEDKYKYIESLYQKGFASKEEREKAKADYKLFRSQYEMCLKKISQCSIISPINGKVISVEKKEGEAAGMGELILVISGTEERVLYLFLKEEDIGRVAIGQKARIYSPAFPFQKYGVGEAIISRIFPYAREKEGERYYEATAEVTKCEFPLELGSQVKTKIIIRERKIWELILK